MREILFRGKTENGEWYYGSLHQYTVETPLKAEKRYKIQEFNYGYSDDNELWGEYMSGFDEEVIPETVGQFTGLIDKNGKKIFEGDIVGCFGNTQVFKIEYCKDRCGYFLDDIILSGGGEPTIECLGNLRGTIEIIGNIHDNPELLEGAQV